MKWQKRLYEIAKLRLLNNRINVQNNEQSTR